MIMNTIALMIQLLSLHDALPIYGIAMAMVGEEMLTIALKILKTNCNVEQIKEAVKMSKAKMKGEREHASGNKKESRRDADRKSTRLNSSHLVISYAVFCLKKKIT